LRQMFERSLSKSKARCARRTKTLLSSICWRFAVRVEDPEAMEGGYRYKMLRLLSHQRRDFILVSTITMTTTMTMTLPFFLLQLTFCLDDCNYALALSRLPDTVTDDL